MAYEYLKGMGQNGTVAYGGSMLYNASRQAGSSSQTSSAPSGTSASASSMKAILFGSVAQKQTQSVGKIAAPVFGAAAKSTKSQQTITPLIFTAVALEPKVPPQCVKTDPGEREELKYWVKMTLGETSAFYAEKLKNDPSFTHMNANVLARYRNSRTVVSDMLRGYSDPNVTVADVDAFKSWWKKCHPNTWYIFKFYTIKNPTFSKMWVPKTQSEAYKNTYRTSGQCPSGNPKRSLFEYKTAVSATDLLKQEQKRQADLTAAQAAADKIAADQARQAANTAQASADEWKAKANEATQQVANLQANIVTMQGNIDALNQQLAAAASTGATADVAALQDQIATLTRQLAAAQSQVPVISVQAETATAQAEAADATASATEQVAAQVEAVAEQSAAATEPWYIRNKWLLLLGAAGVGAGVWWYMKKRRETAVEPTMNRLPPPKSARRPSGLRGNPSGIPALQDAVMRAIESVGGRPRIAVIVDNSGSMFAAFGNGDGDALINALNAVKPITSSYQTKVFVTKPYNGTDISSAMSDAYLQKDRPNIIVVLTDGQTPWPQSAPPGVQVVIGIVGGSEKRKGFRMPSWVRRSAVYLG